MFFSIIKIFSFIYKIYLSELSELNITIQPNITFPKFNIPKKGNKKQN